MHGKVEVSPATNSAVTQRRQVPTAQYNNVGEVVADDNNFNNSRILLHGSLQRMGLCLTARFAVSSLGSGRLKQLLGLHGFEPAFL